MKFISIVNVIFSTAMFFGQTIMLYFLLTIVVIAPFTGYVRIPHHELYLFATIIVGPMLFMKSGVLLLYQYYLLFKGTKQKLAYYLSLFWMPVLVIGVTLLVKYL